MIQETAKKDFTICVVGSPPVQETAKRDSTICALGSPLTGEQCAVIHHLMEGENIFLTGGGGVGKSYLLSAIFTEFPGLMRRIKGQEKTRIQMCALTGCAALLLGTKAKTIHSWAGIGLGKGTVQELYIKITRNGRAKKNWQTTDLLIIDEVSMMTAELLDKLNEIGKKVRGNKKPFGGIQILLVGDFYQLPPVNKGSEETVFAFESNAWKETIHTILELTHIQRQKDEGFQKILKEARMGKLSKESCQEIRKCQGRPWQENKIRPTLLFPRRYEVDKINDANLKALMGEHHKYQARLAYDGKLPKNFTELDEGFQNALAKFDMNAPYSEDLELMENAQVMLIANIDPGAGLVNGSRGIITGFCPTTHLPTIEFMNGLKRQIGPHSWPIESYEFVSRSQIPLRLAWACTIHKSQGASLDSALIDIGAGNFEYGQAYVALSRVKSMEALYVHDFSPNVFKAHPKVKQFYEAVSCSSMTQEEEEESSKKYLGYFQEAKEEEKPIYIAPSAPVQAIQVIKEQEQEQEEEKKEEKKETQDPENWLYETLPTEWKRHLSTFKEKLHTLSSFLDTKEFLPKREEIWNAIYHTPMESVRVIILGQDPYPTPGNAHGLSFSVLPDVKPIPASLKNIYKELGTDVGIHEMANGHLVKWAEQGVLLLNTVLTVEAHKPQSHSKMGWEDITDHMIRTIASVKLNLIFVLWGQSAQKKRNLIEQASHTHRIIESSHPSPLSAHRGFLGSKPFSAINQILEELHQPIIQWRI